MTDHIPADLTPGEVEVAREWATSYLNGFYNPCHVDAAARALTALLPPPPRPTLADMTEEKRDECTGMQADLAQGDRVVILDGTPDHDDRVQVLESTLDVYRPVAADVTPRPGLTRLTLPGTEKPAPALPDGWRLADHKDNGRVIVTTPNDDGRVYYVLPSDFDGLGFDWLFCDPAELTYLDRPTTEGADQ